MITRCTKCGHLINDQSGPCPICGETPQLERNQSIKGVRIWRAFCIAVILMVVCLSFKVWGAFVFPKVFSNAFLYVSSNSYKVEYELKDNRYNLFVNIYKNGKGKVVALEPISTINVLSDNLKSLRIPSETSDLMGSFRKCDSFDVDKRNRGYYVSDDGCFLWESIRHWNIAPDGIRIIWDDEIDKRLVFASKAVSKGVVILPDGITEIGNSVFEGYDGLEGVVFPQSLHSIGEEAFKDCNDLRTLSIPNSIRDISRSAFADCNSLEIVEFKEGDSQIHISDNAFTTPCIFLFKSSVPPSLEKGALPANARLGVLYQFFNSYYSQWPDYARRLTPLTEEDGAYYEISFNGSDVSEYEETTGEGNNDEMASPQNDSGSQTEKIESGRVSVKVSSTVQIGEQFNVSYVFSGNVSEVSYSIPDDFLLVYGPQKGSSSSIKNGVRETLVTYTFILEAKNTGVYYLPTLSAMLNGEQVQSPQKTIEVVHRN